MSDIRLHHTSSTVGRPAQPDGAREQLISTLLLFAGPALAFMAALLLMR